MERMISGKTVLCVKRVNQQLQEEWDDTMPLPGDIIEGFTYEEEDGVVEEPFFAALGQYEFNSQLGKIASQRKLDVIWVKVRRGEHVVKIKAKVVPIKGGLIHRRYTIQAATDDRHVAIVRDLTLEQCSELQEMSRKVLNADGEEFNRRGMKYDWKMKVGTYLPYPRCPVICSILFMPLSEEHSIEATTTRSMAWFSAAVTSGAPLVFVNIQTELVSTPEITNSSAKEASWGRQQNHTMNFHIVKGIRLWFLPGISEVPVDIIASPEETRFGLEIKLTDEGFICIYSVASGSAADRAGLYHLQEEAASYGYLLIVSRLGSKSVMPSRVCSSGLINSCDQSEVREVLTKAIERMEAIRLHIMAWPKQADDAGNVLTLRPPGGFAPPV